MTLIKNILFTSLIFLFNLTALAAPQKKPLFELIYKEISELGEISYSERVRDVLHGYLLSYPDLPKEELCGANLLKFLIKKGNCVAVDEWLKLAGHKIKIDAGARKGSSALHLAQNLEKKECVRILLKYGASVSFLDPPRSPTISSLDFTDL